MNRPSLDEIFAAPKQPAARPSLDSIFGGNQAPTKPQVMPQGLGRTAFDQGLNSALFGFGDDITDRIGAGIASVATGENYDELLDQARQNSKERLRQQFEQNPKTAIAANIVGGLATGIAGGTTRAGAAIGNSLRTGGTAARIGKGIAAGAASGALYGAGSADDGQALEGAGRGAVYGGIAGGAIPAVGAAVGSAVKGTKNTVTGVFARNSEQLAESLGAIKETSSQAYKAMRDAGVILGENGTKKILSNIDSALKQAGPLNKRIHGDAMAVVGDLRKAAKQGKLGLEELEQYRQLFGDMTGNIANKSNGRVANILKGSIDNALDTMDDAAFKAQGTQALQALKTGRAEYARGRKFEAISDIIEKSGGDANKLKRDLTGLLNNKKKTRGFTPEELQALKQAANQTTGEGLIKMVGKFGFDLGSGRSVGNTALPVLGGGIAAVGSGVGTGAIVPVIGTAARQGQKYLARGKAENLLRTIEGATNQASTGKAITPLFSAPAGAAAGALSGGESAANKITIRPPVNLPEVDLPKTNGRQVMPDKQSSITPDLIDAEGVRNKAYKDTLGKVTVGIGFNMDDTNARKKWQDAGVRADFDAIYKGKAKLDDTDISRLAEYSYGLAMEDAKRIVPNFDKLSPNRQQAVVQLSFQLGGTKLSKFKNTLSAIERRDFKGAARQIMNSKLAEQTPSRARKLATMLAYDVAYNDAGKK